MNLTNITSTPVLNESLGQRCFGGDSSTVRALRVTAYGVIILASLVGNSLVILSVVRYKKLRTTTNIFIANMAAADMLITIVYMPRALVMYVNGVTWFTGTSGYVLCKIVPFLHSLAILVSILTLLLISIERLCAFLRPLSYTCDLKTSRKTAAVAGVWFVASLARVPYVLALRTRVHSSGRTYCSSKLKNLFGTEKARDFYYISLLVAFYALPLIFIFISYIVIIARLRKTNNRRAEESTSRQVLHKVVRMMVVVSLAFIACWITYFVAQLVFAEVPCAWRFWRLILAHSNSALNPCLYAAFNRKFRRSFVIIITGLFVRQRRPAAPRTNHQMRKKNRLPLMNQQEKIEMMPVG